MSFILDALRKSESERQREAAPVLARAPLAIVRRETPLWSFVAIGLLSLALVGLGVGWWLGPATDTPALGSAGETDGGLGAAADPAGAAVTGTAAAGAGGAAAVTAVGTGGATGVGTGGAAVGPGAAAAGGYGAEAATAVGPPPRPIEELRRLAPQLPEYRLSLLGTDSAWIDGRRYSPGQRIGDGAELVAVRPDGVVLGYAGERFLLPLN